jgi:hypothetical protein
MDPWAKRGLHTARPDRLLENRHKGREKESEAVDHFPSKAEGET